MNRSKSWAALAAFAVLLAGPACGDEEPITGPVLPIAQWVKVDTFACPENVQSTEQCSDEIGDNMLNAGRVHLQELVFTNADYLFGILSWPLDGATSCPSTNSEGRCVLFDVWGPFNFDFGVQRIAFRLADPIDYRFEYFLMISGNVVADTAFDFIVQGTPPEETRVSELIGM